jgi:hypothetical protein
MPVEVRLDRENRICCVCGWGSLSDDDLLIGQAHIRDLFYQGVLDAGWAQLQDYTAVTDADAVSLTGMQIIAACIPWPREAIRAIVAPSDVTFGLARMYQILGEPLTNDIRVTRSATEAVDHIRRERLRRGEIPPT